jgi:hypothetical protein
MPPLRQFRFGRSSRANRRRHRLLQAERLELRLPLVAEIEPNNSLATATLIGTATSYHTGSLPSIGDVDYFQIPLTQGQIFDANYGQPFTFDPELIGGVEILDSAGRVLSKKILNNSARIYAPRDGTYYMRTTPANEYGAFSGNYTLETWTQSFIGTAETESNDTFATATSMGTRTRFRGDLTSTGDLDYFSFSVSGSGTRMVSIDFVNVPADNPAVIVYRPDGTELGRGDAGLGVQLSTTVNGTYRFAISSAKSSGTFSGQYVGNIVTSSAAVQIPDMASSFDTATPITLSDSDVRANGMLSSLDEARYFYFDVTTLHQSRVNIESLPDNIVMSLYNDRGTLLHRYWDLINTTTVDFAFTAGRY